MARPECTDLRARYSLLSGNHSPLWGRGGGLQAGVFGLFGEEILQYTGVKRLLVRLLNLAYISSKQE